MYKTAPLLIECGMQDTRPGRGAVEDEIVVTVPVACKGLVQPFTELVAAVAARVESAQLGGEAVDYAEIEREIGKLTAGVERAAHGCTLGAMEVDAGRVEVEGRRYARVGHGNGRYYSVPSASLRRPGNPVAAAACGGS